MTKARLKAKMIPLFALFGVVCLAMLIYRAFHYAAVNKKNNNGNDRWKSPWYNFIHELQYFFNVGLKFGE